MTDVERDKLELKIIVDWARSKVADFDMKAEDRCGMAFCILNSGITNPSRREELKNAPGWLREKWPQYPWNETNEAPQTDRPEGQSRPAEKGS